MKVVSLKCPECHAPLMYSKERVLNTCAYCGSTVYVDDEMTWVQVRLMDAKEAGYAFEKGRMQAQDEFQHQRYYHPEDNMNLIVQDSSFSLGRILLVFFVIPVYMTRFLYHHLPWSTARKIVLLVCAWMVIFYYLMVLIVNSMYYL